MGVQQIIPIFYLGKRQKSDESDAGLNKHTRALKSQSMDFSAIEENIQKKKSATRLFSWLPTKSYGSSKFDCSCGRIRQIVSTQTNRIFESVFYSIRSFAMRPRDDVNI